MMNFKIGDKVKFLNDTGGGIISKILDKNQVLVLTDDEWEFPAMTNNLILIESSSVQTNKTEKKKNKTDGINYQDEEIGSTFSSPSFAEIDTKIKAETDGINKVELMYAFVHEIDNDSSVDDFNLYLINQGSVNIQFSLFVNYKGRFIHRLSDLVESHTKIWIETINIREVDNIKSFVIQLIAFNKGVSVHLKPIETSFKIKAAKLLQANTFIENKFFKEKAFLGRINFDEYDSEKDNTSEKTVKYQSSIKIKNSQDITQSKKDLNKYNKELWEIDLHIDNLVESSELLSADAIIEIQLNYFRKKLDQAIMRRAAKVVFVHGIGSGSLKLKLRNEIQNIYKLNFQDASYEKYGFGATMVNLQ